MRAIVTIDDNHAGNEDGSDNESTQVDVDTWSALSECARCNRGEQNLCRIACRRQHALNNRRTTSTETTQAGATAASRATVNEGRIMATLYADNVPARWMVAPATWWPQPRTRQERHANCEWLSQRCRHCGRHEASLFARQPIEQGEELTVPRSLAPRAGAALAPYEVFFNGGTCTRDGTPAAGAGAILWHIHSLGPPTCIARAILAIPCHSSAPLAEAHACGLALHLLTSLAREHWESHGSTLRARLVGGCIPVIRYAAAQARFRSANQRAPVDLGLGTTSAIGWNIEWQAVHRRHNSHAHALAQIAVVWANDLRLRGELDCRTQIEWRGLEHTQARSFSPPGHNGRAGQSVQDTRNIVLRLLPMWLKAQCSGIAQRRRAVCFAMERADLWQRVTAPDFTGPDLWQRRTEKRAAYIRRKQAKRFKARQRHSISKTTLIDTLFNILDTHNIGALGRNELTQFALLTGFQRDSEHLYEEISQLLDSWGSAHALRYFSKKIRMLHFRRIVSRTGTLPMTKAELRRTIRYSKSPEIQGPRIQYGHGCWRSLYKHMKIFTDGQQRKQGIIWRYVRRPPMVHEPEALQRPELPSQDPPRVLSWNVNNGHSTPSLCGDNNSFLAL